MEDVIEGNLSAIRDCNAHRIQSAARLSGGLGNVFYPWPSQEFWEGRYGRSESGCEEYYLSGRGVFRAHTNFKYAGLSHETMERIVECAPETGKFPGALHNSNRRCVLMARRLRPTRRGKRREFRTVHR